MERRAIILRDKSICHICGLKCEQDEIHLDHVVPLSKGGSHCLENVKVAHAACNLAKSDAVLTDRTRYARQRRSA